MSSQDPIHAPWAYNGLLINGPSAFVLGQKHYDNNYTVELHAIKNHSVKNTLDYNEASVTRVQENPPTNNKEVHILLAAKN